MDWAGLDWCLSGSKWPGSSGSSWLLMGGKSREEGGVGDDKKERRVHRCGGTLARDRLDICGMRK